MKTSTRKLAIIASVMLPALAIAATIYFPGLFRSQEHAFTQLMGFIEKGQTPANVRWMYFRWRSPQMRLTTERPDVWSVNGRWRGSPARLDIHFANGKVQKSSMHHLLGPDISRARDIDGYTQDSNQDAAK